MKLNTLIIVGATALLGTALTPAAYAQDGDPRFDRAPDRADARPHRGDAPGRPGRNRSRLPGGPTDRLIDRLDSDGDGFVDVDEFLDARLARVDDAFDRRDNDGDGRLSEEEAERRRPHRDRDLTFREEVIQCVRKTVARWEGTYGVENHFNAVDIDGDGFIDFAELSKALETRAYVLFNRIDSDNNRLISLAEVEAFQKYQLNLRRVIRACIDEVSDPFEARL